MGSVVKRGDVWYVVERIAGKQKWFSSTKAGFPNTERGAKQYLAKLTTEVAENRWVAPSKMTVAEYADRWLENYVKQKCGPNTYQMHEMLLRVHIKPVIGDCKIADLKPLHIEEFYAKLTRKDGRGDQLAPQTRYLIHRTLKGILNHAVSMEVLAKSPIKSELAPKQGKRRIECYDREQVKELLILSRQSYIYPAVVLAVYTGMRVGEICALRWEDVDLDAGTITVQRTMLYTKATGRKESLTKTGKGRTITISDFVIRMLRRLARRGPYVYGKSDGEPRNPEVVSYDWKTLIEKHSDLPYYTFHALRHTHASLLIEQGEHPKTISARLGHSSISITMDRYGHLFKGLDEQAAGKLDRMLANG